MVSRSHDGFLPLNDIIFGCHNSGTLCAIFELIKATKMVQIEHMELRTTITVVTFAAYLKCPTKALLSAHGERPSDTFFTDIERDISQAYRTSIRNILSISFCDLTRSSHTEKTATFVELGNCILHHRCLGSDRGS